MAIKTKEEMFGDGAGFGAAVPFSTTNPAGTGAGNRGINFGEQLTSSIANRPHYALCLNDEDLNSRLADFETNGLDASYRLGLTATPGGGRVIDVNGGAVELINDVATPYATDIANSALRITTGNDAISGSVGIDFVDATDPSETTGNAVAGFLDRRALEFTAGNASVFAASAAARLNPGGFSFTTLELTGGGDQVSVGGTGTATDLYIGYDLVEVSGSAASDGLYVVTALGGGSGQVTLRNLEGGTSPNFATANEAVTCTFYRPRFASFGSNKSGVLNNTSVAGHLSSEAALSVVSGIDRVSGGSSVEGKALSIVSPTSAGGLVERAFLDEYGRVSFKAALADLVARTNGTKDLAYAGNFATKADKTGNSAGAGEFGHIILSDDTNTDFRFDLSSMESVLAGVTISFSGSTATTGSVFVVGAGISAAEAVALEQVGFCEITSPDDVGGTATAGWYRVGSANSATNTIILNDLDGVSATHLPSGGTATANFYRATVVGVIGDYDADAATLPGATTTYHLSSVFTDKPGESYPTAVAAVSAYTGTGQSALFRGFSGNEGSVIEQFRVNDDGEIYTAGLVRAGGDFVTPDEFVYTAGKSRQIAVPGFIRDLTMSADWRIDATSLAYAEATAIISSSPYVFLNHCLPEGADILGITVTMNDADNSNISFGYISRGGEVAPVALTTLRSCTNLSSESGFASYDLSDSGVEGAAFSTYTVSKSGREYALQFDTYSVGTEVHSIIITYLDPGPRNF